MQDHPVGVGGPAISSEYSKLLSRSHVPVDIVLWPFRRLFGYNCTPSNTCPWGGTVFASNGKTFRFEIDPFRKHCLLNGLDDIGLTMQRGDAIDGFEAQQKSSAPWLYRAAS